MNNGELIDALSKLPRGVFACAYGSDGNLHDIKDVQFVNGSVRILAEPMPKKPVKVIDCRSDKSEPTVYETIHNAEVVNAKEFARRLVDGDKNPTFSEYFKLDKWDLFFDGELIDYKTSFCQEYGRSPTFSKWLDNEDHSQTFEFGYFKAVWKND